MLDCRLASSKPLEPAAVLSLPQESASGVCFRGSLRGEHSVVFTRAVQLLQHMQLDHRLPQETTALHMGPHLTWLCYSWLCSYSKAA